MLYMLVGLPGSGKSYEAEIIAESLMGNDDLPVYVSTDAVIEIIATAKQKTYNEVFKDTIKYAEEVVDKQVADAFEAGRNVIWDQTNLSVKTRARKLRKVPAGYYKVAVVVLCLDEVEHYRRLQNRPGKIIPDKVIKTMKNSFVFPTYDEGFDHIVTIHSSAQ